MKNFSNDYTRMNGYPIELDAKTYIILLKDFSENTIHKNAINYDTSH